jgi:hypothetical protein
MSGTMQRKVGKKTYPWSAAVIHTSPPVFHASPPVIHTSPPVIHTSPPQDEDIPARKKPRLQASSSVVEDEADTLNASPDAIVAVVSTDAGPDAATAAQPNDGATQAPLRAWTPEEDTKLTAAVNSAGKKEKFSERYKIDWVAVAALVPGRTRQQCASRWHYKFRMYSNMDRTTARTGKWTTQEDGTLIDAVKKYKNGEDWTAIAALIPGRTRKQCRQRWFKQVEPSSRTTKIQSKKDETPARAGKWATKEDSMLKDAVQKHNGDWVAISALVPGRTKKKCWNRWKYVLASKSDQPTARGVDGQQ